VTVPPGLGSFSARDQDEIRPLSCFESDKMHTAVFVTACTDGRSVYLTPNRLTKQSDRIDSSIAGDSTSQPPTIQTLSIRSGDVLDKTICGNALINSNCERRRRKNIGVGYGIKRGVLSPADFGSGKLYELPVGPNGSPNWNAFWLILKATERSFFTYMPMRWVRQTVLHVTFGGKAEVCLDNCPLPQRRIRPYIGQSKRWQVAPRLQWCVHSYSDSTSTSTSSWLNSVYRRPV